MLKGLWKTGKRGIQHQKDVGGVESGDMGNDDVRSDAFSQEIRVRFVTQSGTDKMHAISIV